MITYVARIDLAEPDRLRFVVDELESKFAKKRPTRFLRIGGGPFMAVMDFGDRKEVWTDDSIQCHAWALPGLSCFHLKKNPHLNDLQIRSNVRTTAAEQPWRRWFAEQGRNLPRALWNVYLRASGREVADPTNCDFVEEADYTVGIWVDAKEGIQTLWRYWPKQGNTPADYQAFFRTCISACGLGDEIRIEVAEQGFRLLSDHWKLEIVEAEQEGFDPTGICVQAPDISTAGDWCDRVRAALQAQFLGMSVCLECREEQYAEYRTAWNSLSRGWAMRFDGGYSPGFDPFTAPLPSAGEGPVSYPLLHWDAGGDDLFYQCDVVAAAEGRYLELLTNVPSEKKILERLKKAHFAAAFRVSAAQC